MEGWMPPPQHGGGELTTALFAHFWVWSGSGLGGNNHERSWPNCLKVLVFIQTVHCFIRHECLDLKANALPGQDQDSIWTTRANKQLQRAR
eukprot:558442-Amphidinium_carterae.1